MGNIDKLIRDQLEKKQKLEKPVINYDHNNESYTTSGNLNQTEAIRIISAPKNN